VYFRREPLSLAKKETLQPEKRTLVYSGDIHLVSKLDEGKRKEHHNAMCKIGTSNTMIVSNGAV
jgi:hypothetical protein